MPEALLSFTRLPKHKEYFSASRKGKIALCQSTKMINGKKNRCKHGVTGLVINFRCTNQISSNSHLRSCIKLCAKNYRVRPSTLRAIFFTMTKLSKWLKGNLKDNVKETFEATIEHLLKLKPPVKKGNKRQALMSSLQALMKNDESVREEYEFLNAWVNVNNSEKEKKEKNLRIVDKEYQAMFKKARVVQYNISYGAGSAQTQNSNNIASEHEVSTDIKEAQEINPLNGQKVKEEKEDNLLSRIPHKFSFSVSKQGSYVEPILEHVEKALFRFVVKNRDYIPSDTVKEFALKCNPREILIFRMQTYCVF